MNQSAFERYIIRAKKNHKPYSRLIIPVITADNKRIGSLGCIDRDMVDDQRIIAAMTKWRNTFMASFLTHFLATEPRTRAWLENVILPAPDRLLFIIFCGSDPVGQIGLCKITGAAAELDNVIRGERSGERHLAYYSAVALLGWVFEKAALKKVALGVLSQNAPAVRLYSKLGFVEWSRHALTRVATKEKTALLLDQPNGPFEHYQYILMCVTREQFQSGEHRYT
jgi:RimJ/RimL family protein N-acetyltransferase